MIFQVRKLQVQLHIPWIDCISSAQTAKFLTLGVISGTQTAKSVFSLVSGAQRHMRPQAPERAKFRQQAELQVDASIHYNYNSTDMVSANYYPSHIAITQAVLHGVPFTGMQVLREKSIISLHEKRSGEPQK